MPSAFKLAVLLFKLSVKCIVPYILLDPLCTFARIHAYRITNASQSQARIQKRGAANTLGIVIEITESVKIQYFRRVLTFVKGI